MSDEVLSSLRERLERADATLTAMAYKARTEVSSDAEECARLRGKAMGVRLALSYLLEEEVRLRSVGAEEADR